MWPRRRIRKMGINAIFVILRTNIGKFIAPLSRQE
jgi:hypothetical protein